MRKVTVIYITEEMVHHYFPTIAEAEDFAKGMATLPDVASVYIRSQHGHITNIK